MTDEDVRLRERIGVKETTIDPDELAGLVAKLIREIDPDPDRPGLKDTPDRVARMWDEFLNQPDAAAATFTAQTGDMFVVVTGIEVWSFCEHHLLPFRLRMSIGYKPKGELIGLSKFARVAAIVAGRLQLQERICDQVIAAVQVLAGTKDVAVLADGWHSCMAIRGPKSNATTRTIRGTGEFTIGYSGSQIATFLSLADNRPTAQPF